VESFFNEALARLQTWNSRLGKLASAIRDAQPVQSGSVCLELYACSSSGCRGCPHGRWMKYVWSAPTPKHPNGLLMGINLDARGQDPIVSLKRGPSRAKLVPLMREAKKVLRERASFMRALRTLAAASRAGAGGPHA
jgi:hypothetical protein